jgi:hypothetical protein
MARDEASMKRITRRKIVIETTETWSLTFTNDAVRDTNAGMPVLPGDVQAEANLPAEEAPSSAGAPVDLPQHPAPRYRRKVKRKRLPR